MGLMDSRIGRRDGVCPRKSGVAEFMARGALVNRQVGVRQLEPPLRLTIAMLDSQIGWLGGQYPRKHGVAKMLGRGALQQQEGVLRLDFVGRLDSCAGAYAPSSSALESS